jgi:hypothetical protein
MAITTFGWCFALPPSVARGDISPTRGEIGPLHQWSGKSATSAIGSDKNEGVISPLVGEMSGRTEGGATRTSLADGIPSEAHP